VSDRPHLTGLNPEQRHATEHFEGPLLVLAGAGSGKTRVLTARICHLVREHGVPPDRILAVTFTNKAAGEMRERIAGLLGREPAGMWVGTFHAMGARMLRRHAPLLGWDRTFSIFDADQSLRLVKDVQQEVGLDPKRWSPKAFRSEMSNAKNQLLTPDELAIQAEGSFDLFLRNVSRVFPEYQRALEAQNAFDFDDLLQKPVQLLEANPGILESYRERFAFVLVDEYQDTNRAQFRLVELLAADHGNLMVVGDDDQSIYGWRGADIRNILDFEESFPGASVVRLERNYRSTATILATANAVIAENVNRKGKTLRTERTGGDPVAVVETFDERDEARWVVEDIEQRVQDGPTLSYDSFAILYRTNAQSRALEDAFRRAGVPYQIVGGVRFYERREIQDVLAYLRLISNPRDEVAFARVVNYPRRGVGATSKERLAVFARTEGIPLLEAAARADEAPEMHKGGARGLKRFAALVQRFSARAAQAPVGELLRELVEDLDLLAHLEDEGPEGEDRARNVAELISGALEFDAELVESLGLDEVDTFTELDLFLQQVALVADVDRLDPDADAVTLMTLHNAKGLEFPVVYVAGMEDGLFPLSHAFDDPDSLEEERRLFYVGITRAEEALTLTWARQRRRAGDFTYGSRSSFVEAIPEEHLSERRSPRLASMERSTPHGRKSRRRRYGGAAAPGGGPTGAAGVEEASQDSGGFDDGALNQDLPSFAPGERVVHKTFGSGSVVTVSGFGRDLKVVVDFDEVGEKRLLARYAGLEKDWP
jgi:DNA helicase-2/ATP-dependent DNA helicase PcrA